MNKKELDDKVKEVTSIFSFHDNQVFIYDTPFAMILPENHGFLCIPCSYKELEQGGCYTRTGPDRVEANTPEQIQNISDVAFFETMRDLLDHFFNDHLNLKLGVGGGAARGGRL